MADTDRIDQNYGIVTNDNVYIGGSCTGCTSALIVQNGGGTELVTGDLVAVTGIGEPLPETTEPTILVTLVGTPGANGVFGVVKNTLEIEMISKPEARFVETKTPRTAGGDSELGPVAQTEDRMVAVHNGVERAALPGDYLVIIVQGLAQVKAEAGHGSIAPGDQLVIAGGPTLSGASLTSKSTTQIKVGTAVEALNEDQGLVWAWVNP